MRKFSLDKLHQILKKKMACRKNSIDNEQDNIMYFATFVVYLPPKRTNKRVDSLIPQHFDLTLFIST